jgi:hypothetical protein
VLGVSAVLVYFVVSLVAHLLAARWATRAFPRLEKRQKPVLAGATVIALVPTIARALTWASHQPLFTTFFALTMVELVAVLFAGLVAALASAIAGAVRLVARSRAAPEPDPVPDSVPDPPPAVGRREAIERIVGAGAFGGATIALGWGAIRGRHAFEIEEVEVRIVGWPRQLDGYTIAQVSDVHVGSFVGERELDEGFELVKRIKPDLVVATGDLVDFLAANIDPLAARLVAVGARDGAFAIPGNHDHYAGVAEVMERAAKIGVHVLCNDAVRLRGGDGGGFSLLGVDDLMGRSMGTPGFFGPDLGFALRRTPPDLPRILLAHQPKYVDEANGRVALQLSGHTHGGQLNPGFQPASLLLRYVAGRYEVGGTTLWVNRGFGVVGPPARIGAPPEVTKLVIVAA